MPHQQQSRPVRRLIIAGGGTAGWMAAAALSRTLGKVLDIKLVESDDIGTVGVGEATIPSLAQFHRLIDIDERDFMAATQATFKLGISFENWRARGHDYIHAFGSTGTDHWTAGFHHFWQKGREAGIAADYGDYCLEHKAARALRFGHLPDDGLVYAYHLDASRYARYLRRYAEHFGIERIEGKIADVQRDPANGNVAALVLDSGRRLEGDLFLDCTGFRSLLLGQTMGVPYDDWSQWLFNDSAIAVQTESVGPAVPYTRAIAHDWGWQWRIPLQHRTGNGMVFSSRFVDDDTARAALLANLEGKPLTEPRVIRFTPGQRQQVWAGNVIGLGLASGFLEPIESTSIHLIQRSIVRLLQLFPTEGIEPADVAEFNTQAADDIRTIRDFIILHYKVTERDDTPYWRAARDMAVPPSLQHRLDLFGGSGRVFRSQNELFSENSWVQVMLGQGLIPRTQHHTAHVMPERELAAFLDGIRTGIDRTVAQMPGHQAYVERYCPGGKP
ncbi:tryptophan halogenase family protein [Duganella phyllosphaerae]|uniref:Flavin-dependent tryptophan halogenase RebH n=1 Tax=Duganella phyllosphaerae TaxID=762836 RepID=A0A1E7X035_9BURK|nr:tryptophan halogenase family protein [Duganella phyllosphaerae]OFA05437.1 flavin-dependent tryptophan halogenase RebH [Duganella phyllosphaerae]